MSGVQCIPIHGLTCCDQLTELEVARCDLQKQPSAGLSLKVSPRGRQENGKKRLASDDKEMTVPWPAGSQDCRLLNVVGSALLTMTEGR